MPILLLRSQGLEEHGETLWPDNARKVIQWNSGRKPLARAFPGGHSFKATWLLDRYMCPRGWSSIWSSIN